MSIEYEISIGKYKNYGIEFDTDFDVKNVGAKNFSPLPNENNAFRSPSKSLRSIIRGFKIGVTKWIRKNTNNYHIWHRNYYEHIIHDLTSVAKSFSSHPYSHLLQYDNSIRHSKIHWRPIQPDDGLLVVAPLPA